MTPEKISAYVPCYNNASTIGQTLQSLQSQSVPIDEIFVIDDGSTDDSVRVASEYGVRVIKNDNNTGRGAVRSQAMRIARNEIVFCVDGSKVVGPKFLEQALSWPLTGSVAGVFGRIVLNHTRSTSERWANRHIYEMTAGTTSNNHGLLVTAGCLLRRSIVMEVGNFNRSCTHSEDRELGHRLLDAKYDVVFDPTLCVVDIRHRNLQEALETYWRWHAGVGEGVNMPAYLQQIFYSLKVLAVRDIKAGDPMAVLISLLSPHYQLWRSAFRRKNRRFE